MTLRKAKMTDARAITAFMRQELSQAPFHVKSNPSSARKSVQFYLKNGEAWVSIEKKEIIGVLIFKVEQYWDGPALLVENLIAKENNASIEKELLIKLDSLARSKKATLISFITSSRAKQNQFVQRKYRVRKDLIILEKKSD